MKPVAKPRNSQGNVDASAQSDETIRPAGTIVTDKLGSYRAALTALGKAACQRQLLAEQSVRNSHQPPRARLGLLGFQCAGLAEVEERHLDFAGVVVALVTQLILNLLGIGIGASTLDPTAGAAENPTATGFSIGAGIWWAVSGILASLAGGYAAGRLAGRPVRCTE